MNAKLLAGLAAIVWLASCKPPPIPLIFVNASESSVRVRVSVSLHAPPGESPRCRFDQDPRQLTRQRVTGGNWPSRDWSIPAGSDLDLNTCVATVDVPAGATMLVARYGGFCSDYQEILAQAPNVLPQFKTFSVETALERIELEGWQVAAAFLRKGDICVFRHPARRG